jgi:hypothetical protein
VNKSIEEINKIWIDINKNDQIQDEWEIEDIPMNSSNSFQAENSSIIINIYDEEILNISIISMNTSILDSVYTIYKDNKLFDPIIIYPE